jgi:hypothetical protein
VLFNLIFHTSFRVKGTAIVPWFEIVAAAKDSHPSTYMYMDLGGGRGLGGVLPHSKFKAWLPGEDQKWPR